MFVSASLILIPFAPILKLLRVTGVTDVCVFVRRCQSRALFRARLSLKRRLGDEGRSVKAAAAHLSMALRAEQETLSANFIGSIRKRQHLTNTTAHSQKRGQERG